MGCTGSKSHHQAKEAQYEVSENGERKKIVFNKFGIKVVKKTKDCVECHEEVATPAAKTEGDQVGDTGSVKGSVDLRTQGTAEADASVNVAGDVHVDTTHQSATADAGVHLELNASTTTNVEVSAPAVLHTDTTTQEIDSSGNIVTTQECNLEVKY